jgi:hypothetical protein
MRQKYELIRSAFSTNSLSIEGSIFVPIGFAKRISCSPAMEGVAKYSKSEPGLNGRSEAEIPSVFLGSTDGVESESNLATPPLNPEKLILFSINHLFRIWGIAKHESPFLFLGDPVAKRKELGGGWLTPGGVELESNSARLFINRVLNRTPHVAPGGVELESNPAPTAVNRCFLKPLFLERLHLNIANIVF